MFEQAVHTGRVYRYKKSGGGRWKECWMVVLSTGQLIWYNDKRCSQLGGTVDLRKSLDKISVGRSVAQEHGSLVPKPPVDFGSDNFLAVPTKKGGSVQWLYAKTEKDLAGWIRAFASVVGKSTAYEIVFDKYRKVPQAKDLRRAPSGDDDEKYRRLGLSIREPDAKGEEMEELNRPEIDWGQAWQEILSSKVTKSEQKPRSAGEFLRNGGPNLPTPSSTTGNGGDTGYRSESSSGADTWDLPPSEDDGTDNSNALLEEVMTVVADVHSPQAKAKVVVEKL